MALTRKVLYAALALALLVYLGGLLLSARPVASEGVRIDARPAAVYALIDNSVQAARWLPRLTGDPDARTETGGPPRGAGAALEWSGGNGAGRHVVTDAERYGLLTASLVLDGGAPATQRFLLSSEDGMTRLEWRIELDLSEDFAGRYLALVTRRGLEARMRTALAELEALAAALPGADFGDVVIEHHRVEARDIAWLTAQSAPDPAAVSRAMGAAYFRILSFIDRHGLSESGPPMSVSRDFAGGELRFEAAIPVSGVDGDTPTAGEGVRLGRSYAGAVVRARHVGPYRTLGATHDKVAAYLAASGIERNGDAWETYVTDPSRTAEENLETWVTYPVVERE